VDIVFFSFLIYNINKQFNFFFYNTNFFFCSSFGDLEFIIENKENLQNANYKSTQIKSSKLHLCQEERSGNGRPKCAANSKHQRLNSLKQKHKILLQCKVANTSKPQRVRFILLASHHKR